MRKIEIVNERFWKFAVTGNGGTGKTSLGVTAPNPLIVLSERQGVPSIAQAAKRLGKPVPPIVYVEEADDYRMVCRALQGSRDKPFELKDTKGNLVMKLDKWPETVVVDSLSDACDVLVKEIRRQSPQKKGRDGLPVDAQRFWGVLVDRVTLLIKAFRDLPMHVVFLCLLSDKTKEDGDGRVIQRIMQPKLATQSLPQVLSQAVNVLGYTYRTWDKRQMTYMVMTAGPEGVLTKPCAPLATYEIPDITDWIRRLSDSIEGVPQVATADGPAPDWLAEDEAGDDGDDGDGDTEVESEPDSEDGVLLCAEGCGADVDREGDVCAACESKAFGDGEESQPQATPKPEAEDPDPDPFKLKAPARGSRTRRRNQAKEGAAG